MLRRLTQDAGRFKAGVLHDWPLATWNAVAADAGFKSLDAFSHAEEMSAVLQAGRNSRGGESVSPAPRQAVPPLPKRGAVPQRAAARGR